jgi:NAD(P)-dependent dehydrogenase (short-subunit alcohol dehydrogenase family)
MASFNCSFGGIDRHPRQQRGPSGDIQINRRHLREEWELTFRVNIHAMFYLTKAAVPHMKPGSAAFELRVGRDRRGDGRRADFVVGSPHTPSERTYAAASCTKSSPTPEMK